MAVNINGFISSYWYDASGERVIKTSGDDEGIFVNGIFSGARTSTDNFTAYINPYLVVTRGGNYTKHIYIGSQRIVSKLGDLDSYGQDPRRIAYAGSEVDGSEIDYAGKYKEIQNTLKGRYSDFQVPYNGNDNDDYVNGGGFCCDDNPKLRAGAIGNGNDNPETFQYYYHSDHLGSTSLITDLDGNAVQHVEYVPFGEVFIEERNNRWNTPYLFNAKELDEETGLYYYGARYYDGRTATWLGVDPMWEKYPGMSVYAYCGNNPIKFIDPDGKKIDLGQLTAEQTKLYNNTVKLLSNSKLFNYYYQRLVESEITYTITGKNELKGKTVGGYYNPNTHEVSTGENIEGYVIAQELFHAFQDDGHFYTKNIPIPYSTMETEGDIMAVYVMLESDLGFPNYGEWMNDILHKTLYEIPSFETVHSDEYQKMFQKAVDDRIQYYKGDMNTSTTYTSPNTGEKPKALETVIKETAKSEYEK